MQQEDGDVIIEVFNGDKRLADVEFCSSGTQSENTWLALTKLMSAMEKDEIKRPHTREKK
jgi:protein tyrosine phosphatase (PTP) superfamily phosphohydrolase (DUF442 family)